jgi:hypothetical protein
MSPFFCTKKGVGLLETVALDYLKEGLEDENEQTGSLGTLKRVYKEGKSD